MKRITVFLFVFLLSSFYSSQAQNTEPVKALLQRVAGKNASSISLEIRKDKGNTYYQYEVKDGVLNIQGSDNIAICRGFYDYVKTHYMGLFTWSGNNISLPDTWAASTPKKTISPFLNHFYLNVVTYGYSMPYWDWERWEKEIDWMALHGINMPLALVGYEAILARVWKQMGLTEKEINDYFVGPAHLPWMRMGNISGIDGPLNADWHASQIELQHKILDRMRALGMKPVCPAFPGFLPEAFKRIYPDLNIVETHWGRAFHNWMISPDEPLFSKILTAFVREWEKEFGKNEYYLIDSFNEMEIPFRGDRTAQHKLLASYGGKVYGALKAANPKAVWTMMGWMFGYQRDIWDYETLGALVSKVPDNKMLFLDLAADYNKHIWHSEMNWEFYKGFYNKQWVYSVIPNMGGKTAMTGILDFYANGHLEALASANKGNLIAHGAAPEGIENNEVLYELVTDAGWSNRHIDVRSWLEEYSKNRYGKAPATLMEAWDCLLKSCYGSFTDHPRFNWQFRPGSVKRGTVCINENYFKGLELFAEASGELSDNSRYLTDLSEMTALYLGGKAEILTGMIDREYLLGDTLRAQFLQSRFETLMLGMDRLLQNHPTLRLDRWVGFASKAAKTPEQKKQYETNARRIVTIWGPPVDDYSARIWNGLIGNYYLCRWKKYYESRTTGQPVDLAAWERAWVEDNHDRKELSGEMDIAAFAHQMIALSKDISMADLKLDHPHIIGTWSLHSEKEKELTFHIPDRLLSALNGFYIERLRGKASAELINFELIVDGKVIASNNESLRIEEGKVSCPVSLPAGLKGNNECILKVKMKADSTGVAGILGYTLSK